MNQIEFRQVTRADYAKLETLIRKTWGSKASYPAPIERALRKINLYHYLSEQNYNCLAIWQGEIVGVILGRSEHLPYLPGKLRYLAPLLWNKAKLLACPNGRRILRNHLAEARADRALLCSAKKEFDSELVLFITDPSMQRHGIGSALLQRFYQFMRQNGCQNIYLFTDTSCNYGFYQRKGYRRIAEKCVCYQSANGPKKENHFLYTKNLEHGECCK